MPVASNGTGGVYQNVLQINGTEAQVRQLQGLLSKLTPETAAFYQVFQLLPEGKLKDTLLEAPIMSWVRLFRAVFGRKYTSGDYILGQVLNENVYGQKHVGRDYITNDMVEIAHNLFNQLFGVRIATYDDLKALDEGSAAYKTREASHGISDAAIDRAVFLKQNFFYPGIIKWDLNKFEQYPLVAPIPAYEPGQWYTGEVIGGAKAVNGLIPVDAVSALRQILGDKFDPNAGTSTTTQRPGASSNILDMIKANPGEALLIAAGLGFVIYTLSNE